MDEPTWEEVVALRNEVAELKRKNQTFHALADAVARRFDMPIELDTEAEQVDALAEDLAISCLLGELKLTTEIERPGSLFWFPKDRYEELVEWESMFDLRWAAERREIKRWQADVEGDS